MSSAPASGLRLGRAASGQASTRSPPATARRREPAGAQDEPRRPPHRPDGRGPVGRQEPGQDQVLQLRRGELGAHQLFDGTRTLGEIHDAYQARFPDEPIEMIVRPRVRGDAPEDGPARTSPPSSGTSRSLRGSRTPAAATAEQKAEGFNIFLIPFHVFDPNRVPRTARRSTSAGSGGRPTVAVALVFIAMTIGVIVPPLRPDLGADARALRLPAQALLGRGPVLRHPLPASAPSTSWPTATCASSTAATSTTSASPCFYFTPAFYCDTTDALLFASKWHRLWVAARGHVHRGHHLLRRDGPLGRLLSGHAAPRARVQDDALHRASRRSSSTSTRCGRSTATTRSGELPRDPGAARGLVRVPRRALQAPRPAPERRGPGALAAQAADLPDLRAARASSSWSSS